MLIRLFDGSCCWVYSFKDNSNTKWSRRELKRSFNYWRSGSYKNCIVIYNYLSINNSDVFQKEMVWRYVFYGIVTISISIGMWYYIAIFCWIYLSSSFGWLQSSVFTLLIDWIGFAVFIPLLMAIIRSVIKCCPSLK